MADDISYLAERRMITVHEPVSMIGMKMGNRNDCHIGRRITRCRDAARQLPGSKFPALRPIAGVEQDEVGARVHKHRVELADHPIRRQKVGFQHRHDFVGILIGAEGRMWSIKCPHAIENDGDLELTEHEAVKAGVGDFRFRWSGRKGSACHDLRC
ncbi:hypothetical protein OIU25_00055 [Rhizobium sp. BT-175]|nr:MULTISPECIES: hypothetical protein [unclassified Rhizobium]MCV9941293.1 hypothetical protein [Rhizobium sp. BT-175]MCW0016754.1 hypothetical protein [Rhizobium sp. BT-226]